MQQSTLPAQVGPVTARTRCRDHQQCSSPRFQYRLDLSPLVQDVGTTNNAEAWTAALLVVPTSCTSQVGPVTARTRCRDHQQCSGPRFQHRLDLSPLVQDVGTTNNAAVHASSTGWTCHHSYKMQGAPTMQQSTLPAQVGPVTTRTRCRTTNNAAVTLPAQVGPVTTRTRCRDHQQCSSPRFQHRLDLSPLVQDAGTTTMQAVHASSTGWTCHRSYKM